MTTLLAVTPPPRGRPRIDPEREVRLLHIEVGYRLLGTDLPVRQIAARYRITRATAYRWLKQALTYDDPEAEGLRRMQRESPES